MNKIELLQKLSEELSSKSVYDEFERNVASLNTADVRLGIMGQPNTAKTTLINGLLGISLPVSNIPSQTNYSIFFSENAATFILRENEDSKTSVEINNEWLKNNKLNILEINNEIIPDETTEMELCALVSKCDVCVYLLNAQSALSRTDLFILKNLSEINMPVALVLSRLDLLSDADKIEVFNYVKSNLSNYKNLTFIELNTSIDESVVMIKSAIEDLIKNAYISDLRKNFENFYIAVAIGKLFEVCQDRINRCEEKKSLIEQQVNEKNLKLNEKLTEWLKVETILRQRISLISDKLRLFLSERKEDILRRLSHDVDVCGDVKLFWEKDFSFRLEELIRSEMGGATQLVNQELIKIMQWLQEELFKQFRSKMSFTTGIVNERTKSIMQSPNDVPIADTQKLKIVTRIGTAATVVAAGALFASSGIGGIIMAVSMVSGLGAEVIMKKQNNESKEIIKKHLPDIVERVNLQLMTDYESKINGETLKLVSHIQNLKNDWMEASKKTIEQEREIALFNLDSNKWISIMERINQFSTFFIN